MARQSSLAPKKAAKGAPKAPRPPKAPQLPKAKSAGRKSGWGWRLLRLGALALLLTLGSALALTWTAMGQRSEGSRRARMERSKQWKNGHFENPEPLQNDVLGSITAALHSSPHASPSAAVPTAVPDLQRLAEPPASGLRATWFGHSSVLVEIDGQRVLTDPQWSDRASPLTMLGPKRWYAPLLGLQDLPSVDVVLISHDHYDHLDERTIRAMKDWKVTFIVPLGVGAHLQYWGIPESRIVELDWWERHKHGDLEIVCTPARHASGRNAVLDKDATLWAGYALLGPQHRVYFSGDTGLFKAMREIGEKLGPFDLTMIEVGQYHKAWPDWHIGPEQAVRAHQLVKGKVLLPIHWALFQLAFHGWTEPGERVRAEAQAQGVTLALPKPGESFEPSRPTRAAAWWPRVPRQTAREHPIVSTQVD